MADRISTFEIAFSGDATDLNSVLAAFKSSVKSAVSEITRTTANVELFSNLDVKKASDAFETAKAAVASLKAQIDTLKGSGGTVGADLAAQFRQAESAASAASKAFNTQVTAITALQSKLTAAGINTGALAAEQIRLAEALKVATAAAAQQSAKGLLGFTTASDIAPQIAKLNAAFETLRLSGTLSAKEISAAQGLLAEKIAAVRAQVSTVGSAFSAQTGAVSSFFSSAGLKIVGFVATLATVVSAVKNVTDQARNFNEAVVQIGTVTNLSGAQLAALGEDARALARTLGIDVVDAAAELYAIIRTGISPDNAIAVLQASAEAAKISQTGLGDATKLTTTLINQYGVQVGDVSRVLDIFIQGAKNGGPTLTELAGSLASLAPIAIATHTPIEDIAAALQVMVKAGVPAEAAVSDLSKILTKLSTEAAQKQLRALGIDATGLVATFKQISDKGLALDELLQLELASKKSASALAALANSSTGLVAALARQSTAVADAAKAQALISDTPAERTKRFSAAIQDSEINLGNAIGAGSRWAVVLTDILNRFNALPPSVRNATLENLSFAEGIGRAATNLLIASANISDYAAAAVKAGVALQNSIGAIQSAVASQLAGVTKTITESRAALLGYTDDIKAQIAASQAATQAEITDLNARAAAEIAALDKSAAAQKASADATVAIQAKLAADRLDVINKNAAILLAAIDAEGQARLKLARQSGADEATIERTTGQQILQARLAILATIKAQYSTHLADLVGQENAFILKISAIDQTQVSFNQDVQTKLRAIRNEGLSDFDAYFTKITQINTLLAQAQTAFEQGGVAGLALGKTYTDQAIALVDTLKTVVNRDGVAVISAFDVQQKKIEVITKAADQYNTALDGQKVAAQDGADATKKAIDEVTPKLTDITKQYDDLNEKIGKGLAINITADEKAIAEISKTIDDALTKKAHILEVKADTDVLNRQIDDVITKLKSGITEGVNTQLDGIAGKLAEIITKAPELKIDPTVALTQINEVKKAVSALSEVNPKVTVASNVGQVTADFKALDGQHVTSYQDIIVRTIEQKAAGGVVGGVRALAAPAQQAWQRFAGGGFTFPPLNAGKVPGIGNEDTVPAQLRRGAFVVRKAASQFYGDAFMTKLAAGAGAIRLLASGGYGMNDRGTGATDPKKLSFYEQFIADVAKQNADTGPTAPVIDPTKGYQPGDSFQSKDPPISFTTRPVPASLITVRNVVAYALEMLNSVGPLNPLLGILATEIPRLITKVEGNPADTASLTTLLQAAETIGTNPSLFAMWGKTARSENPPPQEWFYDYIAKTQAGALADALKGVGTTSGNKNTGSIDSPASDYALRYFGTNAFAKRFFASEEFGNLFYKENPLARIKRGSPLAQVAAKFLFAAGGQASGTDTVAALLTPGEFVVNAPRASVLGPELLHAINDMRFSRADLSAIMSPSPPPRPMPRFAEGGYVGEVTSGPNWQMRMPAAGGGITQNVSLNVSIADMYSVDNVRRFLLPALNSILRASGKSDVFK